MNIIKFLKCKMLFVAAMLFAFVFAYADDTLNIPQKINIQGRLTTDYGDPITVQKTITIISDNGSRYNLSVTPDSEGLYSADVPISGLGFVVDNYPQKFKIEVDRVPSNDYAFSSAPYSIYSSTSVYSIIAGTATFAESLYTKFELSNDNFSSSTTYSNIKLADENFKTGALYTVTVTTSQLAVAANKINSSSTTGMVWGMIEGDNQGWVKVSSIPVDYAATAGTATVAISVLTGTQSLSTGYNVLISSINNIDYTQIWVSTANLTVGTAAFATKASQDAKGNDIEETYEIKFNTEHQLSTECISGLADVAISGSYNSLSDTPIIPAAQIQSDWEQTDDTQLDYIKNKPTIPDYKGGEGIEISSDNTIKVLVDGTNIIINDDGKIDLGSGADLAEIYASSERLQP